MHYVILIAVVVGVYRTFGFAKGSLILACLWGLLYAAWYAALSGMIKI